MRWKALAEIYTMRSFAPFLESIRTKHLVQPREVIDHVLDQRSRLQCLRRVLLAKEDAVLRERARRHREKGTCRRWERILARLLHYADNVDVNADLGDPQNAARVLLDPEELAVAHLGDPYAESGQI